MDKKKKDYLTRTLGMQFLVCVLLFGLLFALKSSENDFFYEIKNMIADRLSENISIEEAVNVFSNPENTVETIKSDKKESEEYVPLEEPSLSAEIIAGGGEDIKVESKDEIPSNVSVESYVLNQNMVLPVEGNVTSEFGVRTHPISGDLRFHAGIDIAAPKGTPIYSAFDGTVVLADYDQWNGNFLKVQHDNGIMTVYCHCEKLNVKKGQVIRAGEIVATVGSTGSSTGPHLHFEIRIENVSYNPKNALEEAVNAV